MVAMRVQDSNTQHTTKSEITMTANYEPPEWSSMPLYDYSLEVIKDGCIIDEIPLQGKEFFVLGRQHDAVDIAMDHPSISRRHAVLNFSKDGSLMLKDLNSAQGVVINKKPCEKDKHIKLNVGDVIKIAASTRLYVVKGPEELMPTEYDSANLETMRKKSEGKIEQWKKQKQNRDEVTWGMREDAEDYTTDEQAAGENDSDSSMDRSRKSNLPEYLKKDEHYDRKYGESYTAGLGDEEAKSTKDKEILEKIRKKERKIQNMQEENRRIYMKEYSQDGGLTEGQLAAVSRNDQQIATASEEVAALVKQIRSKYSDIEKKKGAVAAAAPGKKRSYDDTEELLDMSAQTADSNTNWRLRRKMNTTTAIACTIHKEQEGKDSSDGSLSYEEIQAAISKAQERCAVLVQSIADSQKQVVAMQEQLDSSAAEDDLDLIIKKNELTELTSKIRGRVTEQTSLQERLRHLRKLSDLAKPSLSSLIKQQAPAAVTTTIPSATSSAKVVSGNTMLPPPSKMQAPVRLEDEDRGDAESRLEMLKRAIEEEKKLEEEEKQKRRDQEAEKERQRKAIALKTGGHEAHGKTAAVKGPAKPPATVSISKVLLSKDMLEGGDYVWVPPKSQKGDGRTSLNDKLGY
ncbi:FHA domain-containing protein [archaeon]|nr:MAG: FHA domain-containing protein [archaeon]